MKLLLMAQSALALVGGAVATILTFPYSFELAVTLFIVAFLFFVATLVVEHRQVKAYQAAQQEKAIRAYERELGLRRVNRVRRRVASSNRGDLDAQVAHNQNALVTAAILADDDCGGGGSDVTRQDSSSHHADVDMGVVTPKSSGGFGGSDWGGSSSSFGSGGGGFSSSGDSGF